MELMNVWAIVVGLIITAIVIALAIFIKYEGKEFIRTFVKHNPLFLWTDAHF